MQDQLETNFTFIKSKNRFLWAPQRDSFQDHYVPPHSVGSPPLRRVPDCSHHEMKNSPICGGRHALRFHSLWVQGVYEQCPTSPMFSRICSTASKRLP